MNFPSRIMTILTGRDGRGDEGVAAVPTLFSGRWLRFSSCRFLRCRISSPCFLSSHPSQWLHGLGFGPRLGQGTQDLVDDLAKQHRHDRATFFGTIDWLV